jgi:hypothetical protein
VANKSTLCKGTHCILSGFNYNEHMHNCQAKVIKMHPDRTRKECPDVRFCHPLLLHRHFACSLAPAKETVAKPKLCSTAPTDSFCTCIFNFCNQRGGSPLEFKGNLPHSSARAASPIHWHMLHQGPSGKPKKKAQQCGKVGALHQR